MLINIFVLLQFYTPPISGFCELNITTMPPSKHSEIVNLSENYATERYTPLEQLRPATDDPEHLFNLIYDAQEPDCVQIKLERFSSRASFMIFPDCRQWIDSLAALVFTQISPEFCESHKSCFKCDNETVKIAKSFNGFARERLRLTFLPEEGLLLMEDLSGRGPEGLWMMLRKDELKERPCKCEKLRSFGEKYNKVYLPILSGNVPKQKDETRREQNGTILLVWIMGSIAVPVLVVIVCLCLKLLF